MKKTVFFVFAMLGASPAWAWQATESVDPITDARQGVALQLSKDGKSNAQISCADGSVIFSASLLEDGANLLRKPRRAVATIRIDQDKPLSMDVVLYRAAGIPVAAFSRSDSTKAANILDRIISAKSRIVIRVAGRTSVFDAAGIAAAYKKVKLLCIPSQ